MSDEKLCRIYRLKYAVSTTDVRIVELYGVCCEETGRYVTFVVQRSENTYHDFDWKQHATQKEALQTEKEFSAMLTAEGGKYSIRKNTGPMFSGMVFDVLKQNTDMTIGLLRTVLKSVSPTKSADMLDWLEGTQTERDEMWASW